MERCWSAVMVLPGASTTRRWTCGKSGRRRSPRHATWSQTPRATGGLTWGLLVVQSSAPQELVGGVGGGEGVVQRCRPPPVA